jgi:BolA protein
MTLKEQIEARLTAAFAPERLEVVNDSHQHAGHSGDDGSGESHFRVVIRAETFAPMSRVARHRAVHQALGDLNQRVHAIALDVG